SVLRVYSSQARLRAPATAPSSEPYAQVSHPLRSNHTPPGHSSACASGELGSSWLNRLGTGPFSGSGPFSVTFGSARAGTCAVPKRAGPPSEDGAPTPSRKRRTFPTSVSAWAALGAPASTAHGWGSSKITPEPTWRFPE